MRPPSETVSNQTNYFIAVEIPTHEHTFFVVVVENITFITVPLSGRIRAAPCPGCRVGRTRISHFTFSLLVLET